MFVLPDDDSSESKFDGDATFETLNVIFH